MARRAALVRRPPPRLRVPALDGRGGAGADPGARSGGGGGGETRRRGRRPISNLHIKDCLASRNHRLPPPSTPQEHYPWFLATYRAYPYAIQRVDAVRYFILHRLGGLYLDLDVGCRRRLDFLRRANFTAPLTYPVGISNDVMASAPGSAFATRAIHELTRWRRKLAVHYVTVMFSTGPMFLTVQYALSKAARRGVAAIPPATYGKYDATGDAAFFHLHGSSWHGGGAPAVFWLDAHRGKLALLALAAVVVGVALAVRRRRARRPYSPLGAAEAPADLEKQT